MKKKIIFFVSGLLLVGQLAHAGGPMFASYHAVFWWLMDIGRHMGWIGMW